jgi:hypothetical protein
MHIYERPTLSHVGTFARKTTGIWGSCYEIWQNRVCR